MKCLEHIFLDILADSFKLSTPRHHSRVNQEFPKPSLIFLTPFVHLIAVALRAPLPTAVTGDFVDLGGTARLKHKRALKKNSLSCMACENSEEILNIHSCLAFDQKMQMISSHSIGVDFDVKPQLIFS